MKISGIFLSGVILLFMFTMHVAAYNISGPVTRDTVWTRSDGPYLVNETVLVKEGVVLTIQAGVTVRFDNGTGIEVEGTLIARGNESSPILFTSNQTNPHEGDWTGITFNPPSPGGCF